MPSGSNYQNERRAGLSRNARPPPLLKTLNGKSRLEPKNIDDPPMDDTESELSEPEPPTTSHTMTSENFQNEKSGSKLAKPSPLPQPKQSRFQGSSKPTADCSDSDEDTRSSRADILRTPYYGTSRTGQEQAKEYSASQQRGLGLRRGASSRGSTTAARASKRNPPDEALPNFTSNKKRALSNKLDDEREARKLRGGMKSYSQRDKKDVQQSRKLPERSTIKSSQEKVATNRKKEGRSASPKRPQPSFKAYDDDPFEQFSGKAPQKDLLKLPSLPSSPPGSPPRSKILKHSSLSPGTSPRHAIKAEFKHPSGSLPEPLQSPKRDSIGLLGLDISPKLYSEEKKGAEDSFLDISDQPNSDTDTETRCPMCSEVVDKALLEGFSGGARLHIRRQIQFCRLHKKKSAEDAWDARGYPTIDWGNLGSRLAAHYGFVRDIINGGSSHYASLLVDKVKEGKNRTLLKAEDSLTPGYYGPRGLRALSENIIGNFSSVLRERAVEDRVISSRGYSSYVEAVLVPELAVQLICEDMEVKTDEARTILEESKWIGDLLQEDVGDTVDQLSDDEQAGH